MREDFDSDIDTERGLQEKIKRIKIDEEKQRDKKMLNMTSEANKISMEANKISRQSNWIALFALFISLISAILSIIAIFKG